MRCSLLLLLFFCCTSDALADDRLTPHTVMDYANQAKIQRLQEEQLQLQIEQQKQSLQQRREGERQTESSRAQQQPAPAVGVGCGIKPLPPMGCSESGAECMCNADNQCQWVFRHCR